MKTIPYSEAFALIANSFAVDVDDCELFLPTCQEGVIFLGTRDQGGIYTISQDGNKTVEITSDNELIFNVDGAQMIIRCLQIMKIS